MSHGSPEFLNKSPFSIFFLSPYFYHTCMPSRHSELKQAVLSRQREYKMAAIHAKQSGNIDQAKQHCLTAKVTEPMSVLSHDFISLVVYVEKVRPLMR